jgi:biopolymer transport protein ExbD
VRLPQRPPKKGRIEIIPMIDAIFFLLVFFMFSSLSMVKMKGLGVALPRSPEGATPHVSARAAADAPKVMVTVSAEGLVSVDDTPLNPGNIPAMVRNRLAAHPGSIVIVRPDEGGRMQQVVAVMDALNEVALPDGSRPTILIATEPVEKPQVKP